jgi:WD40 repeat protein
VPLGEAEEWLSLQARYLSQLEREYIQTSVTRREDRAAEREARRQRELESARNLAEEQRLRAESEHQRAEEQLLSTRRLRMLAAGLFGVFLAAVVAAFLAVGQRHDAETQSNARATEVVIRTTAEADAKISADLAAARADDAVAARATEERERVRANQEALEADLSRNYAISERDRADEQAQLALARQLAAQSATLLGPQLDLALLISLEANNIDDSAETTSSILAALQSSPGLVRYLRGHPSLLQSAVFSPDGKHLITVGSEGLVLVWDVESGELLQPLVGHDPAQLVNRAAFSPDGDILATGSDDTTIILWDPESGEIIRRLIGHDNWVQALDFSPDGSRLISSGGDRSIYIWDVNTGQLLTVLPEHSGPVWDVAYSPDGQHFASSGADNVTNIYDAASHEILRTLVGHTGPVFNAAFSPNSTKIATGSGDNTVIIWDVESGEPLGDPIVGHAAAVLGLSFSPDGQTLATGSVDSNVALWDVESGQRLRVFIDHNGMVNSVEYDPSGEMLASGDLNGLAVMWDADALGANHIGSIEGVVGGVNRSAFLDGGMRLLSAGVDGFIRIWDTASGEPIGEPIPHGMRHNEQVGPLAFSPDGELLASGSDNGTIMLWEVITGQQITTSISALANGVSVLEFSPDSSAIAAGSPNGPLTVWDLSTGIQIGPFLAGHVDQISTIAFSPDSRYLASGAADGTIVIRPYADVVAGQGLGIPISHTDSTADPITALTFDSQNSLLATSDTAGVVSLWDPVDSQILTQTTYTGSGVPSSLAFSPDGTSILLALLLLKLHSIHPVATCAFSVQKDQYNLGM